MMLLHAGPGNTTPIAYLPALNIDDVLWGTVVVIALVLVWWAVWGRERQKADSKPEKVRR